MVRSIFRRAREVFLSSVTEPVSVGYPEPLGSIEKIQNTQEKITALLDFAKTSIEENNFLALAQISNVMRGLIDDNPVLVDPLLVIAEKLHSGHRYSRNVYSAALKIIQHAGSDHPDRRQRIAKSVNLAIKYIDEMAEKNLPQALEAACGLNRYATHSSEQQILRLAAKSLSIDRNAALEAVRDVADTYTYGGTNGNVDEAVKAWAQYLSILAYEDLNGAITAAAKACKKGSPSNKDFAEAAVENWTKYIRVLAIIDADKAFKLVITATQDSDYNSRLRNKSCALLLEYADHFTENNRDYALTLMKTVIDRSWHSSPEYTNAVAKLKTLSPQVPLPESVAEFMHATAAPR